MTRSLVRSICSLALMSLLLASPAVRAGNYRNLSIAVYFRYQEVQSIPNNLPRFAAEWENIEKQVKVDKVYLEATRNGQLISETAMKAMKKFFQDRGIKVSAGLGLTVQESNQFQSYCYSNPDQRAKVKAMVEFTARFVDEIILDDFYFTNCKCDRCIANKGAKSWTEARIEQMDQASKQLIIDPAEAINPRIRIIIKYPNWYESFQGLGYDLAVQPKLFDAIYTGTETRDANSGQRLQSYQSYLQTQYFNNIKPGGNQGGWIDGGRDIERYAEQFWDTFFAKVPEIVLFNSMQIAAPLNVSGRPVEQDRSASLYYARLLAPIPQPDGTSYTPNMVARIAGYSAELLDPILAKLGKPIGLAVYKPCNSVGESYLPNYLGMIGVPLDLVPEFPANAPAALLTEASRHDKDLVTKVKKFVQSGGRVIATSGLLEALGDNGFQDIAEIRVTSQRVIAKHFPAGRFGFGGPGGTAADVPNEPELNIVLPKIGRFENDNRLLMPFTTAASGYPMAVSASYGQGTFCVLAVPDDFADLYRMPKSVLNQIRDLLGREVFVSINGPDHVSLFAYDNRTFIVQNFRPQDVNTRVSVARSTRLHDLLSGKTILPTTDETSGDRPGGFGGRGFGGGTGIARTSFEVALPAHSFRVFQIPD